jgi:hypothetical protein
MKRSLSPVQLESNAVISSDPERQSHEPPPIPDRVRSMFKSSWRDYNLLSPICHK